jgi:hypothetical protein
VRPGENEVRLQALHNTKILFSGVSDQWSETENVSAVFVHESPLEAFLATFYPSEQDNVYFSFFLFAFLDLNL